MANAYTPGLTVSEGMTLHKERKLPLPGQVLVEVGDTVEADTVVARTSLPGDVHLVNLANALSVPESDVETYLLVKPGEPVEKDAIIAETKGIFGFFKSQARAPVKGILESVSTVTGQAILREPPTPLEVTAYVRGTVAEVFPDEGVVIETYAAFVQGILGIGGETHGPIALAVDRPDAPLTADVIQPEHAGSVLIGGSRIVAEAVTRAREVGVHAIVAGGMDDADLRALLGYELGVAITGTEEIGLTIIITEGFGEIAMAARTFELLASRVGERASVNGATQIRAGVLRPEILIPSETKPEGASEPPEVRLEVGAPVRIIREPYFGAVGVVSDLPVALVQIETEARVRVVTVRLDSGEEVTLPRANIELIEGAR